MLRASAEDAEIEVDLAVIIDADRDGGLHKSALLAAFAESVVQGTDAELEASRAQMLSELGAEQLVDATAIIGHFETAVRIADSTGIPLDPIVLEMVGDLPEDLGFEQFGSARNTLLSAED